MHEVKTYSYLNFLILCDIMRIRAKKLGLNMLEILLIKVRPVVAEIRDRVEAAVDTLQMTPAAQIRSKLREEGRDPKVVLADMSMQEKVRLQAASKAQKSVWGGLEFVAEHSVAPTRGARKDATRTATTARATSGEILGAYMRGATLPS